MDVFNLRNNVIQDYGSYVRSFLTILDRRIDELVTREMSEGLLWPDPLIQLNPSFEPGETLQQLFDEGTLHPECINIFRAKTDDGSVGPPFQLHRHQVEAIRIYRKSQNYVLTTGTGSGKSLAYIIPIVDHVLRRGSGKGIQAIIVYPMNALANSQIGELEKFLCRGYANPPVTFRRYTGQESDEARQEITASPPDILLTNYVMLELLLTRPYDYKLITAAEDLRFLVLDELHTYRGRQGADVAMLVRRVRESCKANNLLHVGTSATLAGGATWQNQQDEVSKLASLLFGAEVRPESVIGETLRRLTPLKDNNHSGFIEALKQRITEGLKYTREDKAAFLVDPLTSWIESSLGLHEEPGTNRLVRSKPLSLTGDEGAANALSKLTGLDVKTCNGAIQEMLLRGYETKNENDRPFFAFRLHQFISKGESVYASPEPEDTRYITLQSQQFVPGAQRQRVLLPLGFCRECGQEYYVVRRETDDNGDTIFTPRQISDQQDNDDGEPGFLFLSSVNPWPEKHEDAVNRLPDAWLESDGLFVTVKKSQRHYLPQKVRISSTGIEDQGDQIARWIPSPFRFCLRCGVAYSPHQQSDFGKLATLGSEGRSTATTVMSMSTVRNLRKAEGLDDIAHKLLSFTDNRQDASLQAGHFNDFVEISILRSALWRAIDKAGEHGIQHENLTHRVFDALELPFNAYSAEPGAKYAAKDEIERALREVLGYYLYRDLKRGWRITSPNLEQCGLLDIDYQSLGQICADLANWSNRHPLLARVSAGDREKVCRVLLDFLRRELAIRVDYLDPVKQESIRQLSAQRLVAPWAIDDQEKMDQNHIVFPRSKGTQTRDTFHFTYLSPRGGFGLYLKRPDTFQDWHQPLKTEDIERIMIDLLEVLREPGGLVYRAINPGKDEAVGGYQLNASAMIWKAGSGTCGFHDPIRVPAKPEGGLRTNPFFTAFYQGDTRDLKRLEAKEHTAQVPSRIREEREERFRKALLPILYCSPTMELGVDISQLNAVNMRNAPPTPANYAQRSGRAGRSGQPAFVYTYCSAGSPHDQYFFKHPELMVAGSVTTPRLDLGNEDLLRAHVHAIWLEQAALPLGSTLRDILDLSGEEPSLKLMPMYSTALRDVELREKTRTVAQKSLGKEIRELVAPDGDPDGWLDHVLMQLPKSFDSACDRWRDLYRAALNQVKRQQKIVLDPSRDPRDRESAKRLRGEAEAQLRLLLESSEAGQSDFYSYRYFASEGFLPGYNFPRLPLSAFLPGQKKAKGGDEFLTRPRFLAISEFGPRSIIYHEGSRYVINKIIIPVDGDDSTLTRKASQCMACGYIHPIDEDPGPDRCEKCRATLPLPYDNLFRMQNVATRRIDRINSDEEERLRLGYELKTGVRFSRREGILSSLHADLVNSEGYPLLEIQYGHSATIWRMNLGWRRRKNKDQYGFILDIERGFWARNQEVDDDPEDPISSRTERVIPYVEDTRNCILIKPFRTLSIGEMASLEAALKTATQISFQLEDRELASEALPSSEDRQYILMYESAEGGAGVLRRFVEDPLALPEVLKKALELTHFDPETGEDRKRALNAKEDCEAACYNCLLSYFNQRDHRLLDRQLLPEILMEWSKGIVRTSSSRFSREAHLKQLLDRCDSDLEKQWIRLVDRLSLKLPSDNQVLIKECHVRPDFMYREENVLIFVDGPDHDTPHQKEKDRHQEDCLIDKGYTPLRFRFDETDQWETQLKRYPSIFGNLSDTQSSSAAKEVQA